MCFVLKQENANIKNMKVKDFLTEYVYNYYTYLATSFIYVSK